MEPSWESTPLAGVKVLTPPAASDPRGLFVKTYHAAWFAGAGIPFEMHEEFFSISNKGVIRGMHFQVPPHDHWKIVSCTRGRVLDVLLDLRRSQPTFGQAWASELSEENRQLLVIPPGLAHGFLALEPDTVTLYKTSRPHSPGHDRGVRYDSFGFAWPEANPLISDRDGDLPPFERFESPFH
jgi:dTDP-4-dehydrorhamnose 3,5-epimerase